MMRAITKFLLAYPRNHRSPCNDCPTLVQLSSYTGVPRRSRSRSSSAFGRRMTTRFFSSYRGETKTTTISNYSRTSISPEEQQPKDDKDDDETHRRKNKNQNKLLCNSIFNERNDEKNDNININNSNNSKNWLIVGDGGKCYPVL